MDVRTLARPLTSFVLSDCLDLLDGNPSLSLTPTVAATTPQPLPPDVVKHRQRIVQGFAFSRWFILTYQPVILAIVLLIATTQCYQRWSRRRTRWHRGIERSQKSAKYDAGPELSNGNPSASSSSSRSGSRTPPQKAVEPTKGPNEYTPLLESGMHGLESSQNPGTRSEIIWATLQSSLMYQPAPLPIIQRTMPSIATCLAVLSLLGLNLFYLLYDCTDSTDVLADRAGLLFAANLPWLYLLAAKNQPIKTLTGYSYENLNLIHRRLGELMCLLALVHSAGMILAWYHFLRPVGLTLVQFLTLRIILFGIGALICYEALYLTSLASFREWWYELFLGCHIFLQMAALVLLFLHHHNARPYTAVALVIFALDRLIFRLVVKTRAFQADLRVLDDGETVLVSADWPIRRRAWMGVIGRDMAYGWQPSEHVFITVPALAKKHLLQFHPMTIASAAPGNDQTHAWFNLIVRAKNGFSKDLLEYASHHSSTTIRLDGPYGSLHALEMLQSSDRAIIVAGGSGIAVAYPLIWSLLHRQNVEHVTQDARRPMVCLIWIIQDASHLSWIGAERLEELQEKGLNLMIPSPTRKGGRPDVASLLHAAVGGQERMQNYDTGKVGVVVSGPDGLNREVNNTCAQIRGRGRDIEVAIEKFGW